MYKWLAEELQKAKESKKLIKQIFICNAQRKRNPSERECCFDDNVVEIAKTHNWGLLSTLDLYYALLKIEQEEISKDDVISMIENQKGLIEFK